MLQIGGVTESFISRSCVYKQTDGKQMFLSVLWS